MPRRTPNREVLRAESSHLVYEIEMLCALADYFETGEVNRAVAGLRLHGIPVPNAVIESFALHVRQLIDFLSPPPSRPKDDDVFAKDYNPGWSFDAAHWKPGKVRVHKHVAHLTLTRSGSRTEPSSPRAGSGASWVMSYSGSSPP